MIKINTILTIVLLVLSGVSTSFVSCVPDKGDENAKIVLAGNRNTTVIKTIIPGAEQLALYVPKLRNKEVGLVVNHTSRVGGQHLLDTLLSLDINVSKVYSPEHGFTGTADAGEHIPDEILQRKMAIPVISLYGEKKAPNDSDLNGIEVMVFDIQDVGVRFYTYISTLHYVMEACAEHNIPLIVLDRPNPHGHYVDGPVLKTQFKSFVGMHPIPVVYGMTIGELALMINGEAWLKNGVSCDVSVIRNANYTHLKHYELPVAPSPNLPDQHAISLYPSLCFFEATPISVGRGTNRPFSCYGHPSFENEDFTFIPAPNDGSSSPKLNGISCNGVDLSQISLEDLRGKGQLELKWLLDSFKNWKAEEPFFNRSSWFDKLAGTSEFREQIIAGHSEQEIRASWTEDLDSFKSIRKQYLLYPDFE